MIANINRNKLINFSFRVQHKWIKGSYRGVHWICTGKRKTHHGWFFKYNLEIITTNRVHHNIEYLATDESDTPKSIIELSINEGWWRNYDR